MHVLQMFHVRLQERLTGTQAGLLTLKSNKTPAQHRIIPQARHPVQLLLAMSSGKVLSQGSRVERQRRGYLLACHR